MKPYPNREALVDPAKAELNTRLSKIRMISTENIFGIIKKKYPILKTLRAEYKRAGKLSSPAPSSTTSASGGGRRSFRYTRNLLLYPHSKGFRLWKMPPRPTWSESAARLSVISCCRRWSTGGGDNFDTRFCDILSVRNQPALFRATFIWLFVCGCYLAQSNQ
jgi:hypothetical protein